MNSHFRIWETFCQGLHSKMENICSLSKLQHVKCQIFPQVKSRNSLENAQKQGFGLFLKRMAYSLLLTKVQQQN